ncbi:MAG: threonylcarbamoyl-AMP synthase [Deltaproteobacteria bacterium]|nr:threonylcarbamoyl-AMP synthase [Deltaproteobacteria bacterium]
MKTAYKIKKINPDDPDPKLISEAVNIIRKGGIIAFPTKGLYGIGADAFNFKAVKRIFDIKRRPLNKPVLVLINDLKDLDRLATHVPKTAKLIIDAFWPGNITIVFKAKEALPDNLTAGSGKVGVRLPVHKVSRALVGRINGPITGTSANISGKMGCSNVEDMDISIIDKLDLILDAGHLKGGPGSSVIDVTLDPPEILREGEISEKKILNIFKYY